MKKLFLLLMGGVLLSPLTMRAQDVDEAGDMEAEESAPVTFSGSVDAYYRQNITAHNVDNSGAGIAPSSSFANQPGFSLGMINLIAAQEGKKAGFVGDLVFGTRGQDAVFNATGTGLTVNQLYAYWNASDKVTFTLGNFNTFLGYEVISPTANFNYSTSYMFSYGPFSHSGIKADIGLSDQMSLMLGVFNPTDWTDNQIGESYILGAQLGYEADNGGAWLNFRFGDENGTISYPKDAFGTSDTDGSTFQVDLTTGWDLSDDLYLGFNGTYKTTAFGGSIGVSGSDTSYIKNDTMNASGFYGAALYLQYAVSDNFKLGLRGEYFNQFDGDAGSTGAIMVTDTASNGVISGSIIDITLSANISLGNLTLIPEFRVDLASADGSFPDTDFSSTTAGLENSKMLASFLLAAVYSF